MKPYPLLLLLLAGIDPAPPSIPGPADLPEGELQARACKSGLSHDRNQCDHGITAVEARAGDVTGTVPRVASGELDHGIACLALVAFAEARSEGAEGMALVMHTVLNRVGDRRWETSICDVIAEPEQYHGIRDWPTPREPWRIDAKSWALALETAQRVIDEHAAGLRPCDADITHFDQARRTPGLTPACRHGVHQFYVEAHP